MHRSRVSLAILALAATLAGCSSLAPADHPPIDGVFVAVTGASDSLVFRANLTGEWIRPLAQSIPPMVARSSFTYRSTRRALEATMYCPPNANCVAGPHYRARLDHGELIVEPLHRESSEPAWRYRRVGG